jgi:hypothetical protein
MVRRVTDQMLEAARAGWRDDRNDNPMSSPCWLAGHAGRAIGDAGYAAITILQQSSKCYLTRQLHFHMY